ncbi:cytochrome/quinol oxidase subunit 3 [Proteobacteria bacterium 005FR1]|nr:cytochrome/quinol oxidase subunit 3 [Proteobacteria bacterium 005FR1]
MKEAQNAVRMQFEALDQQKQADTLGMWIFLATEVLFFGGMFMAYAAYRWFNPDVFVLASKELNLLAGSINTAVLLSSSLTMALADHFIHAGNKTNAQRLLTLTISLGLVFLLIKGYEYHEEYSHGLIPFINDQFQWEHGQADRAELFFNLYFLMTGMHALHLFLGCCLLTVMLFINRGRRTLFRPQMRIKLSALYWHFVDVVWVFLFPLFYLAR